MQESWGNNFNLDEDRAQVNGMISKYLRVEKEHPGAFFYKTSFANETLIKVFVCTRKAAIQSNISIDLTRAYTIKRPLPEAKRNDIRELIDKNVIPNQLL